MDARLDSGEPEEGAEADENEDEDMPVDRAPVLEAAEILLDYAHMQKSQRMAAR